MGEFRSFSIRFSETKIKTITWEANALRGIGYNDRGNEIRMKSKNKSGAWPLTMIKNDVRESCFFLIWSVFFFSFSHPIWCQNIWSSTPSNFTQMNTSRKSVSYQTKNRENTILQQHNSHKSHVKIKTHFKYHL